MKCLAGNYQQKSERKFITVLVFLLLAHKSIVTHASIHVKVLLSKCYGINLLTLSSMRDVIYLTLIKWGCLKIIKQPLQECDISGN